MSLTQNELDDILVSFGNNIKQSNQQGTMTGEFNYLKGFCKGFGLYNATKAMALILKYHGNQTRNDGSPYYIHPVKVALHLVALNIFHDDKEQLDILISGALLHDVLEDTKIQVEELRREFNDDIANVVILLTKTKEMSNEVYYDNIKKSLLSSLIKISDRCNNVSTMAGIFNKKRLQKYVDETNGIVKSLIRHTRDTYPQISNQVVNMGYHIDSVIHAIEVMLPLLSEK